MRCITALSKTSSRGCDNRNAVLAHSPAAVVASSAPTPPAAGIAGPDGVGGDTRCRGFRKQRGKNCCDRHRRAAPKRCVAWSKARRSFGGAFCLRFGGFFLLGESGGGNPNPPPAKNSSGRATHVGAAPSILRGGWRKDGTHHRIEGDWESLTSANRESTGPAAGDVVSTPRSRRWTGSRCSSALSKRLERHHSVSYIGWWRVNAIVIRFGRRPRWPALLPENTLGPRGCAAERMIPCLCFGSVRSRIERIARGDRSAADPLAAACGYHVDAGLRNGVPEIMVPQHSGKLKSPR